MICDKVEAKHDRFNCMTLGGCVYIQMYYINIRNVPQLFKCAILGYVVATWQLHKRHSLRELIAFSGRGIDD